jgi:hypothetical protein
VRWIHGDIEGATKAWPEPILNLALDIEIVELRTEPVPNHPRWTIKSRKVPSGQHGTFIDVGYADEDDSEENTY